MAKGEKVSAKAHGGAIDIQGVTVATVNDKLQLQSVRTWFDPMDMFRQIAPGGEVKKEAVDKNLSPGDALDSDSKAEIDQMPRPRETALHDGTAAGDAQKLMEAVGCPFAGHDGKKAGAPYDPAEATSSSDDSGEQSKLEHPNAPLSDATIEMLKSGKQEDADRDPYVELTEKTGS
ncbi:hypothetical protein SLS60_004980 [Paraconiothyrium brasiliense]|uniref:Uncharacterized protein n=1 Tax=Paraconiothyrium brasiliense TaxID=300254 RepID=A0ABR3RLW7_9PLEO